MSSSITVNVGSRTRRWWLFKAATWVAYRLEWLHLRFLGLALMRFTWRFVRWEYRVDGGKWRSLAVTTRMLAKEMNG